MKAKDLAAALYVKPELISDICAELKIDMSRELTSRENIAIIDMVIAELNKPKKGKKDDGIAN